MRLFKHLGSAWRFLTGHLWRLRHRAREGISPISYSTSGAPPADPQAAISSLPTGTTSLIGRSCFPATMFCSLFLFPRHRRLYIVFTIFHSDDACPSMRIPRCLRGRLVTTQKRDTLPPSRSKTRRSAKVYNPAKTAPEESQAPMTSEQLPNQPSAIERVVAYNRLACKQRATAPALTGKPSLHLAVLTCIDTRLTRLLPQALGLNDGDAAIIKVAGATIADPYGEAMRSLLVAVAELGVTEVMVIGHTDCGTCGMAAAHALHDLERAGADPGRIEHALAHDARAADLLNGFSCLEDEVARSVQTITQHPLMPHSVRVEGFIIDIETGTLTPVVRSHRAPDSIPPKPQAGLS